jgi:N-acetylglucosamine-6-phosphate deacetylase
MVLPYETTTLVLAGGDVILPGGQVLESASILIDHGFIQDIGKKPPTEWDSDVTVIDASGHWITPGLIDQHMHGAFGIDFNQASIADIHKLLKILPQHGITGVLPTVMTASKLDMVASLTTLEEVSNTQEPLEARIFGLHLEGPFLSPEYRGAHPKEHLLTPSEENMEGLLPFSLKRLTLAPELDPQGKWISQLVGQDILCSIGHSGADFITATHAIRSGASCATHLFNAMARIDHRNPGIIQACLLDDNVFVELITDGKHLSPITIQMALRLKPLERAIIISDCNALTGMPAGSSMQFGNQHVTIHEEGALNEEGRLAGSTMLVTDCVRNLVFWNLLSFPDAVQMATHNPAQYLGESPRFGQITSGAMADIVLWNKADLQISEVFLGGIPVRQASTATS